MWKYNETDNLPGKSLYHSADELYHYGIPGMRWRHRKAQMLSIKNSKKKNKKISISSKKKNIETRKKVAKVLYNTAQGTGYAAKKFYLDPMTKDMRTSGKYLDLYYQMSPEYRKRYM